MIINLLHLVNFRSPWVIVFDFGPVYICFERREFDGIFGITGRASYPFCQVWDLILPTYNACYCLMDSGRRHNSWIRKKGLSLVTQQAALLPACMQRPVSHLRSTELKGSTTHSRQEACLSSVEDDCLISHACPVHMLPWEMAQVNGSQDLACTY